MKIPPKFATRDSQTRIKHGILRGYAGAWAGIISSAAERERRQGKEWKPCFLYIDAFGGAGRYGRDTDKPDDSDGPVWGSPVHAIDIIARTIGAAEFSALVVESVNEHFDALVENLTEAELPLPIVACSSTAEAKRQACNLLHTRFGDVGAWIAKWASDCFALAFVDPYGAGMSLRDLRPLLARERTDCIILFPVMDIDRKGGSIRKPKDAWTAGDRGNVTRIENVFDSDEWQAIQLGEMTPEEREGEYVRLYSRQLQETDADLVVKTIRLRLSSIDRTGYYLFLTTRDASGALRMNELLQKAEFREHFAIWADYLERARRWSESAGELSLDLGDISRVPEPTAPEEVPIEAVVERIVSRCGIGRFTWKQLFTKMADEPFTESELRRAVTALKGHGRASIEGRKVRDSVEFWG